MKLNIDTNIFWWNLHVYVIIKTFFSCVIKNFFCFYSTCVFVTLFETMREGNACHHFKRLLCVFDICLKHIKWVSTCALRAKYATNISHFFFSPPTLNRWWIHVRQTQSLGIIFIFFPSKKHFLTRVYVCKHLHLNLYNVEIYLCW